MAEDLRIHRYGAEAPQERLQIDEHPLVGRDHLKYPRTVWLGRGALANAVWGSMRDLATPACGGL